MEPVLLQQVLSLHPLRPGSGLTAAGPPPRLGQAPARLRAGITVLRIHSVDQKLQTFAMHYRVRFMHRDCRFLHNCTELTMSDEHPLYSSHWQPPWTVEEEESTEEGMKHGFVSIYPDGGVSKSLERVGTFRCSFDFTEMPFDKQTCTLTLVIPAAEDSELELVPMLGPRGEAALAENLANAEWAIDPAERWKVESLVLEREVHNRPRPVRAVRWSFSLRRKSHSILMKFVFPSVLYYFVSWLGLWIDASSVPARAAIGVIPVLIMATKLGSLHSVIPPIGYASRLESFLLATLTFIVLQMLEFGFVNYGLRRQRADKEAPEDVERPRQVVPDSAPWKGRRKSLSEHSLELPDRLARAWGSQVDVHFRWVSMFAYAITSIVTLLA